LLHQVGDLFELNIKFRCQNVNIILGLVASFKEASSSLPKQFVLF
jgi:hypothetical protein